ncbi:carbohydrate ABC transporter permease [Anaerolinea thermophila]|uniref:ABC transporter permease protein n=1 Tax=Anaerolinea thermophila (strain DSM 14523 / JCM 11388 / NBRC 100420 / UNI-1) TaxID=926569 RepID=E8N2N6_ANATU|nr:sugar ABC transporter permease [Anaerolinea thermophila]BAJ62842.1 putative ABC transporter permease protein [Anaerolinea thermophila UNI-1]
MLRNPYLDTLITAGLTVLFIILTSYGLAALARQIQRWRGASPKLQQDTFAGYLFAAPWITGFLIFVVFPLAASLYWSFTDYRIAAGVSPKWVGFSNYLHLLLKDTNFRASIVNTLFLVVVGLPLQIGVALFLAVILNQKARGEKVFRMAFYLPVILGFNAAVLLCWRLMLNTGTGIINQILRAISRAFPPFDYLLRAGIFVQELISAVFLGIGSGKFNLLMKIWEAGFPPPNRVPLWIQSPLWSKTSVILLMIWGCGAMMMIFLAGLNNIPRELHEAAEVDGATRSQRFWKITFPLLTPYIFYNLVVGTINTLQIFEPIYVLYRDNQPLVPSAISMVYYLWQVSFRHFEIGMGSAISWLIMILILIVTVIQFRLQNRWVTYELY